MSKGKPKCPVCYESGRVQIVGWGPEMFQCPKCKGTGQNCEAPPLAAFDEATSEQPNVLLTDDDEPSAATSEEIVRVKRMVRRDVLVRTTVTETGIIAGKERTK